MPPSAAFDHVYRSSPLHNEIALKKIDYAVSTKGTPTPHRVLPPWKMTNAAPPAGLVFKGPKRPSIYRDISYLLRRDSAIDLGEEANANIEDVPKEAAQFEAVISPRQFKT